MYSNIHALLFITKQEKLNQKHGKWVEFMHNFTFVLKRINGSTNKVADALRKRCFVFNEFQVNVLGLEYFKEIYS